MIINQRRKQVLRSHKTRERSEEGSWKKVEGIQEFLLKSVSRVEKNRKGCKRLS